MGGREGRTYVLMVLGLASWNGQLDVAAENRSGVRKGGREGGREGGWEGGRGGLTF